MKTALGITWHCDSVVFGPRLRPCWIVEGSRKSQMVWNVVLRTVWGLPLWVMSTNCLHSSFQHPKWTVNAGCWFSSLMTATTRNLGLFLSKKINPHPLHPGFLVWTKRPRSFPKKTSHVTGMMESRSTASRNFGRLGLGIPNPNLYPWWIQELGIDVPTFGDWLKTSPNQLYLLEIYPPHRWVMWNIGTFTNPNIIRFMNNNPWILDLIMD